MGAGGRRQRPMSFYSTDIENPKKAHVVGCITQLLFVFGCVLTFGSISVIVNGLFREYSSIMAVGIATASVGVVLLISAFIVCGAVLKHSCCHPGKPTLGQVEMQAFMAARAPVPLMTMQPQNTAFSTLTQPQPQGTFQQTQPGYVPPQGGFAPMQSNYAQGQYGLSHTQPGSNIQLQQTQYSAPPPYESVAGPHYTQAYHMQEEGQKKG